MPSKAVSKTKKTEAPKKTKEVTPKKVVVVEEVDETPVEAPKEETKPVEEKVVPEEPKEEPKSEVEEVVETDTEEIEEEIEEKPKIGKLLWIVIPTTLLVGALAGGIITYFSGVSKIDTVGEPTPVATISPDVEETSTPEPEASLKREDLKVQVLNGSGVAGAAGKVQSFLQDLGYVEVAVGNASSSDFTATEISIKKDKNDYLDMLIDDLSDSYTVDEDTATLSATSTYDVVVTLGSK